MLVNSKSSYPSFVELIYLFGNYGDVDCACEINIWVMCACNVLWIWQSLIRNIIFERFQKLMIVLKILIII